MSPERVFRYQGYHLDPDAGLLTCTYSLGSATFTERITFGPAGRWDSPVVAEAARLVFLLAGVSYYKTGAPAVIDLGGTPVTGAEREFLRTFYLDGLAEFAYRNGLDLSGLRVAGGKPHRSAPARPAAPPALDPSAPPGEPHRAAPASADGADGGLSRVLIPFGGGIDSIVTVELMRTRADAALFVMSRPGDRYAAIEKPGAVTGLPIVRADREIDPQVLRSAELGFLNGHVPITGILSAIAVMAAVLAGRDTVVMSNEWSASVATLEAGGRTINHQYSKSAAFESAFRRVLAPALGGRITYFSALRPFTELWVAQRFVALTQYHSTFRSCNKAFQANPALRPGGWCGRCDKCCFIDLILAPFLPAADLQKIFDGAEPLADPTLAGKFRALLGTGAAGKPFECVGEVSECRAAAVLAAGRPDRARSPLLHALVAELPGHPRQQDIADLLRPVGEHSIPDAYATDDLLV